MKQHLLWSIVLLTTTLVPSGCGQTSSGDPKPTATLTSTAPTNSSAPVQAAVQPPVAASVTTAPKLIEIPQAEPTKAEAEQPKATPVTRQAEVLLSTRAKGVLTVAMDFAGTPATDKKLALEERRQYVSQVALELYAKDFIKREKPGQKVKLFAIGVPNRDDYLRGDFRNMEELAIFETTQDQLKDETKSQIERLGIVEWRAAMK